jgi:hypothetical protein
MHAVIDRIAEGQAVLLLGKDETLIYIPVDLLPEGAREGTWLDVNFSINEKLTSEQYRKNRELLEKIKRKNIR